MKDFTRTIIILCFVLCSIFVSAQNPGYQGKKLILSTSFSGMPVSGRLIRKEKFFDFNVRSSLDLEYVFARGASINLSVEKVQDVILIDNYSASQNLPIDQLLSYVPDDTGGQIFSSSAFFSGFNYGCSLKLYRVGNGAIAPLGSYLVFGAYYNDIEITDDGRYFNNDHTFIHEITTQTYFVGGGIQNVFFNHVTVDLSLRGGLNAVGISSLVKDDRYESEGGNLILKKIEKKMFSDYIIYSTIRVGWLLF